MALRKDKQREYYLLNKQKYYLTAIKNNYGLSPEDYLNLLEKQNHRCAICNQERKLQVDHCHETNKIRGLLCMACNVGLGMLNDNEEGLLKAVKYVRGEL